MVIDATAAGANRGKKEKTGTIQGPGQESKFGNK
jgi:hypothetical protein